MARQGSPIVRWMAWLAAWVFYRVDRVGGVPASGAVIILPNHPNALLDPAVVWATAGRDVRFHVIDAPYGHDCFLLEEARQTPVIQEFLAR